MEHVSSPWKLLLEFRRTLKRDGVLLIGIPNKNCLFFDYYELDEPWNEHIYSWSKKDMCKIFNERRFKVEKIYCNFPGGPVIGKIINFLFKNYMFDLWFVCRKSGKIRKKSIRNKVFPILFDRFRGIMTRER